jgi:hypothetical protein
MNSPQSHKLTLGAIVENKTPPVIKNNTNENIRWRFLLVIIPENFMIYPELRN